jgi:amino acid adenylation domain-containing protein
MEQWLIREMTRPFDLSRGAFRATIVSTPDRHVVLLFVMHHIISDGSTMEILLRDLSVLYAAYLKGEPSPLAPLKVQYADYALWQRQWLQGEVLERQLAYWSQQLSDMPAALELPTDRPRPPVPSFRGAQHVFTMSPAQMQALRDLARREGVTPYMVMLAALQVVLSRWSNQQDVTVASPIAGRTHPLTEGLVGVFVNTLVMRTDLSGDPEFRELLQRVRETTLGAYAYQETPFEKVVAKLRRPRDRSRQALFQTMFVLHNLPKQQHEMPGITLKAGATELGTSKFDLTLEFYEAAGSGRMEYATDLFDAATIERLTQSYQQVLQAVTEDAAVPISELPLISETDRQRQLVEWNATAREYPQDRCVHELFAQQAARTPEAIALVCGERQLSYRELDERANQLAHYLREHTVGPETVVGVCMPRSIEQIVSVLGVLKAGAAWLPLDPTQPAERLRDMLEDAAARLVLVNGTAAALPSDLRVVDLRLDAARIGSYPVSAPRTQCTASNLAYVIYTSGSTGRAKAVGAVHRSLVNRVFAQERIAALQPGQVCCQKTAVSFVDAVFELFGALLSGCRLVIADEETGRDAQQLLKLLRSHRVEHLVSVPSLARALLGTGEAGSLKTLKHWTLSGEALSGELLRELQGQLPWCELANVYGCSEVGADASVQVCAEQDATPEWVSIGGPLPNVQLYVLDELLQPVPAGVVGELYVGGAGVARLPRSSGSDGGAFRGRSVRRGRRSAVPNGRPGALSRRRQAAVPRSRGSPGEDPRLPHRARRDRSEAQGAPADQGCRGDRPGRRARREAPGRVLHGAGGSGAEHARAAPSP